MNSYTQVRSPPFVIRQVRFRYMSYTGIIGAGIHVSSGNIRHAATVPGMLAMELPGL